MEQKFAVRETHGEKMSSDLLIEDFIPVLLDADKPDTALESELSQERGKNSTGF